MVDLTTSASLNGGSITIYVEWDNDGNGSQDGSESVGIGGGTNTYTLSSTPIDAAQYRIDVRLSGNAKLHSADLSDFVSVPTAPQSLEATVSGVDIDLAWQAPSDWGGESGGYYVYRGTASGSYSQIAQLSASTTTYADTGLTEGEMYFYVVRAFNTAGTSGDSNEAVELTDLPAPTDLSVSYTP